MVGDDPESVDPQELALFMRQQHIEPAALPPEIKRAVFTDLWDEYVIQVKRTAKVTKSGRLQTSHVLLVVGNMDGLVGVGSASGSNLQQVMMSALAAAYRNIVPVARYRWVPGSTVGAVAWVGQWPTLHVRG
jgi:ribosomal protein S5